MKQTIMPKPINTVEIEEAEVWEHKHPITGDHIRVNRSGIYNHHGIYVSDDEVIHFTGQEDDSVLDWSKCEVISTNLATFLKDGSVEVKIYTDNEREDLYPVESIISYARACLGDKGYNLVFNNCEHFANVCTLGRFRSRQVENLFRGNKEDIYMGFFSGIWGGFKRILGFGSSGSNGGGGRSTTTYEPDKVKVAQVEADTKIRLADMEKERIDLMKQARIEILEFEVRSNLALEEARARGLANMAQTIVALQDKLNEVAEKRLVIIEKGSLQIIRDIEMFYDELGAKIKEEDDKYNTEKLPEMLSILEKYDEGSAAHKLYTKRIEDDMTLQAQHYTKLIDAVLARQSQVIDGFLTSKERILEQTGNITSGMLDCVQNQVLSIEGQKTIEKETLKELPIVEKRLELPQPKK